MQPCIHYLLSRRVLDLLDFTDHIRISSQFAYGLNMMRNFACYVCKLAPFMSQHQSLSLYKYFSFAGPLGRLTR